MKTRRNILIAATAMAFPAQAQDTELPNRPLRLIIPFAPGGASDIVARLMLPTMQQVLGRSVIIENRPGATGNIGMEAAARSTPDGTTMVLGNAGSTVINPSVFADLTYSPMRDLAPVTLVAETPNIVVVNTSLPPNTIRELIAYVRARQGELNYGSAGSASQNRLEMEMFMAQQGLRIVHIPYRGGAGPAVTDLLAGHVGLMFVTLPSVLGHVRAGRLKALAVTTAERFPGLPEVPTMLEQGFPDNVSSSWQGLLVPAATPAPIVQRIFGAVVAAMGDAEVKRRLIEAGAVAAVSGSPAEFTRFVAAETARWREAVLAVGARPD